MIRPLRSLSNRIFLASVLLAALSIGAALFFVRARLSLETQQALDRDLQTAASLADQQQAALFDTFTRSARLLADLPRFKAAVDTGDPPTVQPIAEEYLEQLKADTLRVEGQRGALLAAVDREVRGVLREVTVPIRVDQDRLGTLVVGYVLDERRANELGALTGAEIAFADDGRVLASTLGDEALAVLNGIDFDTKPETLSIGGTDYVLLARPLHPESSVHPASVIVLHSLTARLETLAAIQTFLVGLAVGSVLLAVGLSFGVARTVTRPLARITDHMRQVARSGDLTRKLTLAEDDWWPDEDTQVLARTFNSLTEAIARFQREVAQRERLSALGRMSTVIAHEVRNPLMIIKGALRTITRPGIDPADLRDAAGDIDEEIARLNRLVHEVLDFARPIRFECAPTDINRLCEEAVRAVSVNGQPVPRLDGGHVPAVITDRERIRTVLVNLLTNAQQAVATAGADADTIAVSTIRSGASGIIIAVRDRGPGIAPDDLGHIFDPYFTTRRGGTGLGLAISKNIVEGLGGTLTVNSRPGEGTEFRIELGPEPPEQTH
ncbi:MAG TPA: ATP-binding protein [Vicinamibacterales bacterium]|nr:ATP-binding protein [Vicinamibacterales bacterium]